ncbi:MAG TPA: c-type cytochrome [Actinomycetota bacterium]
MDRRDRFLLAGAIVAVALAMFAVVRPSPGGALAQTPTPAATSPFPTTPAGPGRYLYLRDCAWCHGSQGEGSNSGPPLIGVGAASADFMLSTGRMPIPAPKQRPVRAQVPYTRGQVEQLVSYVASFGSGPAIPAVDPSRGSLSQGADLYQANCAACHSATGAGGALTNGLTAPSLRLSTTVQVAEAIRIGGAGLRSGNMPKFGVDALSDQQVDSIVRYVQYLRRPQDRGGLSLGHFGPIPEGAATWMIGLLALMLIIRWIGTSD